MRKDVEKLTGLRQSQQILPPSRSLHRIPSICPSPNPSLINVDICLIVDGMIFPILELYLYFICRIRRSFDARSPQTHAPFDNRTVLRINEVLPNSDCGLLFAKLHLNNCIVDSLARDLPSEHHELLDARAEEGASAQYRPLRPLQVCFSGDTSAVTD